MSACNTDLPFCNMEFKGECKVIHIAKSDKGVQERLLTSDKVFCFQPRQTLKCYMTGSEKMVFGFGMTVSKRRERGWYVFFLQSEVRPCESHWKQWTRIVR